MALPIEKWARQAIDLEKIGKYDPVASTSILSDISELARLQMQTWKRRQVDLIDRGVPLNMPEGTYGGLISYPNGGTVTTTSINGTVNLYPASSLAAIQMNGVLTPQAYRIALAGKLTTVATPGNIGIDPRMGNGTWTTGGTAITGTTLGASPNVALTASITNAFYTIIGDLTIRSLGGPGANAVVVGMFHYVSTQNTAAGVAGPAAIGHNFLFGGTQATVDLVTASSGIQFGAVHTVATITHNLEQVHAMDWN